jgi:hypothetical protein
MKTAPLNGAVPWEQKARTRRVISSVGSRSSACWRHVNDFAKRHRIGTSGLSGTFQLGAWMGGFAMRLFALVTICVTLLGCADTDPFASVRANRVALTNDSENVHAVMGQPVTLDPLTTEPGDVWADVSSGKPAPASPQQARRLPTPSLADEANNATPVQVPASQSAIMPFETKAQTPTPATSSLSDLTRRGSER